MHSHDSERGRHSSEYSIFTTVITCIRLNETGSGTCTSTACLQEPEMDYRSNGSQRRHHSNNIVSPWVNVMMFDEWGCRG